MGFKKKEYTEPELIEDILNVLYINVNAYCRSDDNLQTHI